MDDSTDRLAEELKALRKGRGIQAPGVDAEVGPVLRELCGIAGNDGAAVVREKLSHWIGTVARALPEDLRLGVVTALGLNSQVDRPFLQQRVAWLAKAQQRDPRTIRRRLDEAVLLLAEAGLRPLSPTPVGSGEGWHVRHFDALVRVDGDVPLCMERRGIVADRNGIDEIQVSVSLPPSEEHPPDLSVEVAYGAQLLRVGRPSASRFQFDLRLPSTLSAGQSTEFALLLRVPRLHPHYVFLPERRCERFDLRVRFDPRRLPKLVWRMSGAFHRDIDERTPGPDLLEIDRIGEVRAHFANPISRLGYGIQWLF